MIHNGTLFEHIIRQWGSLNARVHIKTDFGYDTVGYLLRVETYPSPWLEEAGEGPFIRLVAEKDLPYRGGISEVVCVEQINFVQVYPPGAPLEKPLP